MLIKTRRRTTIALTTLAVVAALAGCASGSNASTGGSTTAGSTTAGSTTSAAPSAAAGMTLGTATTSLGKIVVDSKGMTVYYFDNDTANSGKSTCAGGCLALWPEVHATSSTPTADGVTGKLGTITGTDGKLQVTLNGLPLYTYTGDIKAGDVAGQGFQNIWWVVAPDGTKMMSAATPSPVSGGY